MSANMSAGFNTAKAFPWMNTSACAGAGDTVAVADRMEEGGHDQDAQAPTRAATTAVVSGWYPQATPPPLQQYARPSAEGWGGRGAAEAPQRSPIENSAGPLARGTATGGEGGQPVQPSLAWEATVGAAIRESSGGRGEVRRRSLPRDANFGPRTSDFLDGFGVGLADCAPPAAAVRGGSPRRRTGASSARVVRRGSPRGSRSPDRWSANSSGEKS